MHSECLAGDVFGSRRGDGGPQLHQAMRQVAAAGCGEIVDLRQEGRGIGLAPKITEQLPIRVAPKPPNARYLKTMKQKLGHLL